MNIKLIWLLDYYLGLLICLILAPLGFFKTITRKTTTRKNKTKPIKKILIIKLSEMGAIILSYPFIKKLQQENPQAEVYFLTFERNKEIFFYLYKDLILSENLFLIKDSGVFSFVIDTLTNLKKIRKEKMDIVFDLELFSRFTAIYSFMCNIPAIVGFYHFCMEGLYRGNFLTHRFAYNPLVHISKTYLSLACATKIQYKFNPEITEKIEEEETSWPQLIPDPQIVEETKKKLNLFIPLKSHYKIYIINPGNNLLPIREWPLQNFISLSLMLLENQSHYIILAGSQSDEKKCELLFNKLKHSRCLNLCNRFSLPELSAFFYLSTALICNDCGLVHLASLTQVKKFILFGPESNQIFGPMGRNNWIFNTQWPCSPCLSAYNHRKTLCDNPACLNSIKPRDVYLEVMKET